MAFKPPRRTPGIIAIPPLQSTPPPRGSSPKNMDDFKTTNAEKKAFMQAQRNRMRRELILEPAASGPEPITLVPLAGVSYDSQTTAGIFAENDINGWFMNAAGTMLYAIANGSTICYAHPLSTAYDLTTCNTTPDHQSAVSIVAAGENPKQFHISPDGDFATVSRQTTGGVAQWPITGGDISGITTANIAETVALAGCSGVSFSSTGFYMLLCTNANKVQFYLLSTAFDISTASLSGTQGTIDNINTAGGIVMTDDGDRCYVVDQAANFDDINEYTFSTPYDASTISTRAAVLATNTAETYQSSINTPPGRSEIYVGYHGGVGVDDCIVEKYVW